MTGRSGLIQVKKDCKYIIVWFLCLITEKIEFALNGADCKIKCAKSRRKSHGIIGNMAKICNADTVNFSRKMPAWIESDLP